MNKKEALENIVKSLEELNQYLRERGMEILSQNEKLVKKLRYQEEYIEKLKKTQLENNKNIFLN